MNYERELRHRLQKFGWEVMETTKDWLSHLDENRRPVYIKHPAWTLRSLRPPVALEIVLTIDSKGLGGDLGGALRVGFNDRFEGDWIRFSQGLESFRDGRGRSRCQDITIWGIKPEMTRQQVENSFGRPELESETYKPGFDFRSMHHFELERVFCSYGALKVVYYQDGAELRVLEILGPQLEQDGLPLLFAGDDYDPDSSLFDWRREDSAAHWEALPTFEGWWRLEAGRGYFRLDKSRRYKEFKLGQDAGNLGRRVRPV